MPTFPIAAELPGDRMGVRLSPVPRESEDVQHRVAVGVNVSERMVAAVVPKRAPDPPRQGDTPARRPRFWRSFTLTWPHHEQAALLGSSRPPVVMTAAAPRGRQLPWRRRSNLYRAPYTTYSEAQDAGAPGLTY